MPMLTRIAIVNRGEAAMRLIHAVRDLNARLSAGGGQPVRTIALYTDVDAGAAGVIIVNNTGVTINWRVFRDAMDMLDESGLRVLTFLGIKPTSILRL